MRTRSALLILLLFATCPLNAKVARSRSFGLNRDPDVVYVNEFTDEKIELLVVGNGTVYSSKEGKRKLGVMKTNTKAELIGFTDRAYKIRGEATHAHVSGWVGPRFFASKDPKFVDNLKKLYLRQLSVRSLIANKEVAVGMTLDEVSQSLGKPTKTQVRQTKTGKSGKWEYIVFEKQDHFQTVRDPYSGAIFQQKTHTTVEEKEKIVIEFENGLVGAIEQNTNKGAGEVKIISSPILIGY